MRVGKILQKALKKSENFNKEGSALMIKKFTSGNPIDTQAVVEKFNALPIAEFPLGGKFENGNFVFEFDMADSDIVYGLGEAPRGINKRGWVYNSFSVMTRSTPKQSHPSMPLTISLCLAVQKLLVFLSTSRQKSVGTSAIQPQIKPVCRQLYGKCLNNPRDCLKDLWMCPWAQRILKGQGSSLWEKPPYQVLC